MDDTFLTARVFADVIRSLNAAGNAPATSTNYSFKDQSDNLWVSRTSVDKMYFQETDFLRIDEKGIAQAPFADQKASAETDIHCALYELFPDTKVILHSHSLYPVLLSSLNQSSMLFEGFEIQKGLRKVTTHEGQILIPILKNSQDMKDIRDQIHQRLPELEYGVFMIEKHGFYAWGTSLFEAKRYLETFNYLCECLWKLNNR
jgi:methylthioribulose-1-phosphate dehydratase